MSSLRVNIEMASRFPVKSVNLCFRNISSTILRLLIAYSQKVGQSDFYKRSAGIRQHLSHNLIHCFKGRRRKDKGTKGIKKSKKLVKNEEKNYFTLGFKGSFSTSNNKYLKKLQ